MSDLEELLQRKLEALEDGASPKKTAKGLPGEAAELEPLIYLAASLRDMPHPGLEPQTSHLMQNELVKAAKGTMKLPIRKRSTSLAWLLTPGFASLSLVILALVVVFFGARAWLAGPSAAQTALLSEVSGQVQVAESANADWQDVGVGSSLHSGQLIRTSSGSSATLRFFEGTQTVLSPNTELVLDEVSGGWGNVLHVKLTEQYGYTDHSVIPFGEKNSYFMIDTPAGSASVHGTVFSAAFDPNGKAVFAVEAGQVLVENEQGDVTLDPGQGTAILLNQAPEPPAYTFTLTDKLTLADGNVWWIGGMPFVITSDTLLLDKFEPGDTLLMTGRILENGLWVVDSIQPAQDTGKKSTFAGVVEEIGDQTWMIGGIPVQVNLATRLSDSIQVGYVVEVKYVILGSGSWQAVEISTLVAGKLPAPKPTSTDTPSPSVEFSLEGISSLNSEPVADCTGAEPQPEAQTLADRYGISLSAIMSRFCQGFGFGEIDQAYMLRDKGYDLDQIFGLRKTGLGWGEIEQVLNAQPSSKNRSDKSVKPANENKPEPKPSKTPRP